MIDGVSYQTYCGGNGCTDGDGKAMNWDGGKLSRRSGYFCYEKQGKEQGLKSFRLKDVSTFKIFSIFDKLNYAKFSFFTLCSRCTSSNN